MEQVSLWEQTIVIPTYEIGEPQKNPIFLDKRVYQGSSGKIYPYAAVEKIYDEKVDKEYKAVFLENEYLRIMLLPELGGRIQRAYDKTNDYDFVYYNHVIKPALVGLTGPWISGGIEFNWPQHHRPTTYLPVDYLLCENEDGSKTLQINDVDQMNGTKAIARFTLYPGKAYLEIEGQLYNPTALPQTFLWWANPAVAVNEYTQSIFPPDVHAVMDHGKRDVSSFPMAKGVYYKHDYSNGGKGTDISRYKNIPVPTSYMAAKSKYDFVGGYDYQKKAGLLHVADHHISPGKKQWTWGCGDFGKAWDRNLTDEDGPYIELMTGVFTDNQPDFTWLKPMEEKSFKQYFMPYKEVGQVKNATIHAVVNIEVEDKQIGKVVLSAYTTSLYEHAKIAVRHNGQIVYEEECSLSPVSPYRKSIVIANVDETKLCMEVWNQDKMLVRYEAEEIKEEPLPEPAIAAKLPEEICSNEELYLTGLHLEQYRHATYEPDEYYLEGLRRDPGDMRINNAYGQLLLRRGLFTESETYFRNAIKRATWKNPNPYSSEPYYNLGLTLFYQERYQEAKDAFYKATWSNEQQEMSFYYLAVIESHNKNYKEALAFLEKGLIKNSHNVKARGCKAYLLRKLGLEQDALRYAIESLTIDTFDYVSRYELYVSDKDSKFHSLMREDALHYLRLARMYGEFGAYEDAINVLELSEEQNPMVKYYHGYYVGKIGRKDESIDIIQSAEKIDPKCCFPNQLEDISVLQYASIINPEGAKAYYYLGNLFYDKKQWEKARQLWEISVSKDSSYPTVMRNLSLCYYNKYGLKEKAAQMLEKAFLLDPTDARVFLELDQLHKKMGMSYIDRLKNYETYGMDKMIRDDLFIEYITLINMKQEYRRAYELIMNNHFHPWEGGEGKITTQYTISLLGMAKECIEKNAWQEAKEYLEKAITYPENLGEGKLEGTKDNHINYYLGVVYENLGEKEIAESFYEKASVGISVPAGMMYYNDQPADMILYQGLALHRLGKQEEAEERFLKLIEYGKEHMNDNMRVEYFAVSLPDFLIFEDDLTEKNRAHCNYLLGLGNWGFGKKEEALRYFEKSVELEPGHIMGTIYSNQLSNKLNI